MSQPDDSDVPLEDELDYQDWCPWLNYESSEEDERMVILDEATDDEGLTDVEYVTCDEAECTDEEESYHDADLDANNNTSADDFDDHGNVAEAVDTSNDIRIVQQRRRSLRGRRMRVLPLCPVCRQEASHLHRHAVYHLPWFWLPASACLVCRTQHVFADKLERHHQEQHPGIERRSWEETQLGRLVCHYLQQLGGMLGCPALDQLLQFINRERHLRIVYTSKSLPESDLVLCRSLESVTRSGNTNHSSLFDSDGELTMSALVFYRTILHLLANLNSEMRTRLDDEMASFTEEVLRPEQSGALLVQEEDSNVHSPKSTQNEDSGIPVPSGESSDQGKDSTALEEETTPASKEVIDSHMHLDLILSDHGVPMFAELDQHGASTQDPQLRTDLIAMVANYCFPYSWPTRERLEEQLVGFPRAHLSYGIHPKVVQDIYNLDILDRHIMDLEDRLRHAKVVAVGECGLDTSNTRKPLALDRQEDFFRRQVLLARSFRLPIIIHCRGDVDLYLQLVEILKSALPSNHPIHFHCFSGHPTVYSGLTEYFTNIVFGITPFIFIRSNVQLKDFIINNGLQHLVLESDSPVIKYRGTRGDPFVVNFVAQRIASLLQLSLDEVCRVTTANARRIYRI